MIHLQNYSLMSYSKVVFKILLHIISRRDVIVAWQVTTFFQFFFQMFTDIRFFMTFFITLNTILFETITGYQKVLFYSVSSVICLSMKFLLNCEPKWFRPFIQDNNTAVCKRKSYPSF